MAETASMFDFWLVVKSWGKMTIDCAKRAMSSIKSFCKAIVQTIRLVLRATESVEISVPGYARTAVRPTAQGPVLEMQDVV
ncbi:hypothetical protein FIBSPDRAFT_970277 [Athelia psychrophila]|uniref:Uncharacterized protein n=1 Tax=Athelia psychrophila TaxID=1759441 RepID=A0A167SSV4_9AGAM|nr:hypothetical protein FIBSPDRAFT_970277 [Fibularhizoctonia sp. CBS 109695]